MGPMNLNHTSKSAVPWGLATIVALATLALYAQVARHGFLHYDDNLYVTENPRVLAGLSWGAVRWAFTTFQASNWHPLTWLSHLLDVQLFGPEPGAHHLVNAALHAVNAAVLLLVLTALTGAPGRSALVAALFAVHPLHVESVAWISERKDVLSTLFGLLMLGCYAGWARHRSARWYAGVVTALTAGLLSKPMWVTAPFLLLLLDVWPLRRWAGSPLPVDPACPDRPRLPLGALLLEKLPLLLLAAASSAMTVLAQARSGALDSLRVGLPERIANALVAYAIYLWKTVWPARLAAYYPHRAGDLPGWHVAAAAALLLAVSMACLAVARRSPWLLVGWCWFLGTLLPVIGLVQAGAQAMADRYSYLPLVGLFIAFAWGGAALAERWRVTRLAVGLALLLLSALGAVTWRQIGFWVDQEHLFRHALEVTERNAVAHLALSQELASQGRTPEALVEAEAAVNADGQNARAWKNLGYVRFKAGRLEDSVAALRRAIALDPGYAGAHGNLGVAYRLSGRTAEAQREFAEEARLRALAAPP
jgi:protein O-mannosyl-transferase